MLKESVSWNVVSALLSVFAALVVYGDFLLWYDVQFTVARCCTFAWRTLKNWARMHSEVWIMNVKIVLVFHNVKIFVLKMYSIQWCIVRWQICTWLPGVDLRLSIEGGPGSLDQWFPTGRANIPWGVHSKTKVTKADSWWSTWPWGGPNPPVCFARMGNRYCRQWMF